MYKMLLFGVMLVASLSAAANYNSMEFKTTDGSSKTIGTTGLTITVNGDQLLVTNTAGETATFEASALATMQFVGGDAGVETLLFGSGTVEAYTVDGQYAGKFDSVNEARLSLSNGIYILKGAQGKSIKIIVNR